MRSRIVMMGILFMTMMLLLAGCGGNGGSGTPAMNEDGDQEEPVMPMTAVDLAGLPSVTVPAGTSIAAGMTETFGDVTFTCPAGGEACALSQSDDGGVTSTGGAATAMLSQAAQNRRNQMNAAAMAETNGILGAIVSPSDKDDATTAQGVNLATRPGNAASEAIIVVAGNSGTNVKPSIGVGTLTSPTDTTQISTDLNAEVAIDDTFDKDDMTGTPAKSIPNQFMKKIGSDTTLGEFSGSVHEKTVDGVKDILTLYSDMENSKPLTFASYYSAATRPGVTAPAGGTGAVLGRVLELDETIIDTSTNKDNSGLFVSDHFPTGKNRTHAHVADDSSTTQDEKTNGGLKFAGMFNGVSGTYECTGPPCTSATNAQGKLSTLVGTWTFTATGLPAQIKIPGVDHDSDYLVFGYWLRETTEDDKTTYGVGTFANGSAPMALASVQNRVGKAEYEGPAAGRYGVKRLDSTGQEVAGGRKVGEFTADAKLIANFGGSSVAEDDHYTITGTVTGFKDGDAVIPGNWTLNLMKAGFAASGDDAITTPAGLPTGTFTGKTTGNGDWQGRFFGPVGTATTTLPTGVAGEFTGHFVNGHVIGAFGATKE